MLNIGNSLTTGDCNPGPIFTVPEFGIDKSVRNPGIWDPGIGIPTIGAAYSRDSGLRTA